ncbi:MAG: hypothetical protein MUC81_12655 [Bacteroidia bacterium]|jgi:hypothetical protein|nr:hypothetical protein [Bacteroidia bacterium]
MKTHTWNFVTIGGVKRVNLESGADLLNLHTLDQKLWTALSCPVEGLEIDEKTLALIDQDQDKQIRVPEILEAVRWITSLINNPDLLLDSSAQLALKDINTATEEGASLLASAQIILSNLNKADQPFITVEETIDTTAIFADTKFNGDGIITEDSVERQEEKKWIKIIVDTCGGKQDRGGKQGIDVELLNKFNVACNVYMQWVNESVTNANLILPFGESGTLQAYSVFKNIEPKITDYFLRCKLAAFHNDGAEVLNVQKDTLLQLSSENLIERLPQIESYPISKVNERGQLHLAEGINPVWIEKVEALHQHLIKPLLGDVAFITEEDWKKIKAIIEPYENWQLRKVGTEVSGININELMYYLSSDLFTYFNDLIVEDEKYRGYATDIIKVEQLVRYYRDIFVLLKNFVSFYDFYTPGKKAIFQAGTLYIDQRSCDLCIRVNDMSKHEHMAGLSGMFLMYCECVSRSENEKMTIAAALTNGDIDNLVVGRNAVFYDRQGNDWDATIVKIIDNPISIRQAFWTPYRKVSAFIEKQISAFAAAQDSKVTDDAQQTITSLPNKTAENSAPPASFDVGKFVGIFAAISLAVGAIGTAVASFVTGFIALKWWKMPLAVAGILLLISGPSMIMAYLKLRKRNLAPLLDANGWAVNAGAKINLTFGNMLTQLADLPSGAKVNLNDPFTKKQRPILPYLIFIALVLGTVFYFLWKLGYMHI